MDHEHRLLGYYNYTVILTYVGMLFGFTGIICALKDNCYSAVICLMAAGFCDMFDGTIAATRPRTPQEKCFGIQIDSFSDLICFGMLPAMIVFSLNRDSISIVCLCAFYVLCALIRLAYFNVDEQERQKNSNQPRELYLGMPVTLSALFVPLVYSLFGILGRRTDIALAVAIVIMAILFLLPVPLKKPKMIGKIIFLLCGLAAVALVMFARTRI